MPESVWMWVKLLDLEGELLADTRSSRVVGGDGVELSNLSFTSTTDWTDADQDKQPPQEVVGVVGG